MKFDKINNKPSLVHVMAWHQVTIWKMAWFTDADMRHLASVIYYSRPSAVWRPNDGFLFPRQKSNCFQIVGTIPDDENTLDIFFA